MKKREDEEKKIDILTYLLPAIGSPPGGSSTIHRTTQN